MRNPHKQSAKQTTVDNYLSEASCKLSPNVHPGHKISEKWNLQLP